MPNVATGLETRLNYARSIGEKKLFHIALLSWAGIGIDPRLSAFPKAPGHDKRAFLLHKMDLRNRQETDEVLEIASDVACEYNGGMSLEFARIRELLRAEKELSKARGMLASWEVFRNGISEQYPELLKWCPWHSVAPDSNIAGNYEPLDFLLTGYQPLEIMEDETEKPAENCINCDGFGSVWKNGECKECPVCQGEGTFRPSTITIHDPELPDVVIFDSENI